MDTSIFGNRLGEALGVEHLKENLNLARTELRAVLEAERVHCAISYLGSLSVISCGSDPVGALSRLSLSRRAFRISYWGDLRNFPDLAGGRDFLVSATVLGGGSRRKLASEIAGRQTGNPNFGDPETVIKVVSIGREVFGGEVLWERGPFWPREVQRRPFRSPTSMKPKYARLLVNLSRAPRGGTLLDPFCGAGSILIEAAMMGIRAFGSDADPKLVEGARRNLEYFGLDAELEVRDVGDIDGEFDAIATDPPYGRSSTTFGESVESLMRRAFESFRRVLRPGGHASLALGDESLLGLSKGHLLEVERNFQRVHGSLERVYSTLVPLP